MPEKTSAESEAFVIRHLKRSAHRNRRLVDMEDTPAEAAPYLRAADALEEAADLLAAVYDVRRGFLDVE